MRLRAGLAVFACAAAVAAGDACAQAGDLYGFVDDDGRVHVTTAPPVGDARYQLFLRSPDDYRLKDTGELRNLRNPGDYRLRAPAARVAERNVLDNPLLEGKPFQEHVVEAAKVHQVDPALVHAVILAESNYNPNAVSDKGAIGLMQVMPGTGRRYGVREKDLKSPQKNISTGVQYLSELLAMFDGDLKLALAAYNAGENAVIRYGRKVPPYSETVAYVPRVLRAYEALRLK
jgi:soluble lytic murein transglycosylase-like protein